MRKALTLWQRMLPIIAGLRRSATAARPSSMLTGTNCAHTWTARFTTAAGQITFRSVKSLHENYTRIRVWGEDCGSQLSTGDANPHILSSLIVDVLL